MNHQGFRTLTIDDYTPYIGQEAVERIRAKGEALRHHHVVHVSSTYYGGGVAELLSSMTLLMNSLGIRTGWRIIFGPPDFFGITKKMHNALQGGDINLSELKKDIYEEVVYENSIRNHLSHDIVIIHDPQPLPLIGHYEKKGPWFWRCHIDLSEPDPALWNYLRPFVEQYDAVIVSMSEYAQALEVPQHFFMPAIDPFSIKNYDMTPSEVNERLERHGIPTDLPIIAQVSRFDLWKDPVGVIKAFEIARKEVDCTLVLLGSPATDDPEGQEIYESLLGYEDERILIRSVSDSALVNALQRKSQVILQKSLREGFGLTVTEAMWKGVPVIGGNAGGIPAQIQDGVNGFLVSSSEEAAERLITLLKDGPLRTRIGRAARLSVQENFLMVRLLEQYLDLFSSYMVGKHR